MKQSLFLKNLNTYIKERDYDREEASKSRDGASKVLTFALEMMERLK